jgi:predicted amidophosphoribosyltransferase
VKSRLKRNNNDWWRADVDVRHQRQNTRNRRQQSQNKNNQKKNLLQNQSKPLKPITSEIKKILIIDYQI